MLRTIGAVFVLVLGIVATGGAILGVRVLSRKPLKAVQSTTHATIERRRCLECHAPIADEWRHSFHFKSVTGPYWEDVRRLRYARFFDGLRKRCMDCHAPANVLDLADPTVRVVARDAALGVECTPNVLREPEGIIPSLRSDDVGLGVDCVACHVSRRGIMGAGRRPTWEHETIADPRFQDPMLTSEALCRICHRSAVDAWKRTRFFAEGVTCLDCHMPSVRAASVADGAERPRRSHRFPADKDEDTLRKAFSASLRIEQGGRATFRIVNDGVGHFLPSGGNWVSVQLRPATAPVGCCASTPRPSEGRRPCSSISGLSAPTAGSRPASRERSCFRCRKGAA